MFRDSHILLRKALNKIPTGFPVNSSSVLPQRDLRPCTSLTVYWGEANIQTFQVLLDAGSELTPILGDPKKHCGLQLKKGLMGVRQLMKFLLKFDSQ